MFTIHMYKLQQNNGQFATDTPWVRKKCELAYQHNRLETWANVKYNWNQALKKWWNILGLAHFCLNELLAAFFCKTKLKPSNFHFSEIMFWKTKLKSGWKIYFGAGPFVAWIYQLLLASWFVKLNLHHANLASLFMSQICPYSGCGLNLCWNETFERGDNFLQISIGKLVGRLAKLNWFIKNSDTDWAALHSCTLCLRQGVSFDWCRPKSYKQGKPKAGKSMCI